MYLPSTDDWSKCCFTSAQTVGLLVMMTGAQDVHLDFPELCSLTTTFSRTYIRAPSSVHVQEGRLGDWGGGGEGLTMMQRPHGIIAAFA